MPTLISGFWAAGWAVGCTGCWVERLRELVLGKVRSHLSQH
ncbi:MAG: hypothetical protein AAFP20_01880 [Cyanobacteria bacterium J06614_10]